MLDYISTGCSVLHIECECKVSYGLTYVTPNTAPTYTYSLGIDVICATCMLPVLPVCCLCVTFCYQWVTRQGYTAIPSPVHQTCRITLPGGCVT